MDIVKVFISSVFDEDFRYGFQKEREALKEKINSSGGNGFTDISLDYGEADSNLGSFDKSIKQINNADIIILFIGSKYGTVRSRTGRSLTHEEYLESKKMDKNVLIYKFPTDTSHPDYDLSNNFFKEICENDSEIISDLGIFLEREYPDILNLKKGKTNKLNDVSIKPYLKELISKIYEDLLKAKDSLLYLPKGVEKFEKDIAEMSYVKRSECKKLFNLSEEFLSEIEIYNEIFEKDKFGILIHGEGGLGKTRLSKELALMAKNNNWQVLTIKPECNNLDQIKYKGNSNYCLFFDYIETQMFSKEEIEKHIKKHSKKNKIRVILNSRNTYVNIDDYKYDNNFINLNLSSINNKNLDEKIYIDFVIEKMFDMKGINKKDIELSSLVEKPSFAIFILKTNGRIEDLKKTNFSNYLKNFFEKSFKHKDFKKIDSTYFYILANLPLHKNLKSEYRIELDLLKREKLIIYDDNDELFKASFNDTIIDELLNLYLTKTKFEYEDDFEEEIKNFFNFAIEKNTFKNLINSFGKISSKDIIKNRRDIFKREFENEIYKNLISENMIIFKKSNILDELSKLTIRVHHNLISQINKEFAYTLSRIIDQIIKSNSNNYFDQFEIIFTDWIKSNSESSLKFLYQDLDASFFICNIYEYYSKYGENKDFDINFYVEKYLEKFLYTSNASFILNKYIESEFYSKNIELFLYKYINFVAEEENTHFIIKKYLETNRNFNEIREAIIIYINKFTDKENTSYLIQKYFEINPNIDEIKEAVIFHINKFKGEENINYIIQKYLETNRNFNEIRESVIYYINRFKDKELTNYIIQKYLDNNNTDKDLNSIKNDIVFFISKFKDKENTSYIIQKYFNLYKSELIINDISILKKYLDYLKYKRNDYKNLIEHKKTINHCISEYNFDIKNYDIDDYILVVIRLQEKNKNLFPDHIELKILKEINEYIRKANLTANYLKSSNKYLKNLNLINRKQMELNIIYQKINDSIFNSKFLDNYYNLAELIIFINEYPCEIENIYINIKNEIIKKIYSFLKNDLNFEEILKELSTANDEKPTEKIIDFLMNDINCSKILAKLVDYLPMYDLAENKLTIYYSLFRYFITYEPKLILDNEQNLKIKYIDFIKLNKTFSKRKRNRLREIYNEKLIDKDIKDIILTVIKENIEENFIIPILIKFILAENNYSILKEDIIKIVNKKGKEGLISSLNNYNSDLIDSLILYINEI